MAGLMQYDSMFIIFYYVLLLLCLLFMHSLEALKVNLSCIAHMSAILYLLFLDTDTTVITFLSRCGCCGETPKYVQIHLNSLDHAFV